MDNCKNCIHIDTCVIYQDFEEVVLKYSNFLNLNKNEKDDLSKALCEVCFKYRKGEEA